MVSKPIKYKMIKITKVFSSVIILFFLSLSCSSDPEPQDQINFNWPVSTPQELGLDKSMITAAMSSAEIDGSINSLIIIRNEKIAAEKYFNGRNAKSYQTVRSVSKSFLSAMIGIAIDKGILTLDKKVIDFFPEFSNSNIDQRYYSMTIENLLTMRSGIKGDEEFYSTFTTSSNWIKTIIESNLDFAPGTRMQYSTAAAHLLSVVLTKTSSTSSLDFAKKFLIEPMGISIIDWSRDPQGYYFGGNEMFFTTRNNAALGLLYMNKGKLNDQQIIPEDWVNKSLLYSGGSSTSWGSLNEVGYGYFWWLGKLAGRKVFFALGHGGQYVLCVPDLNMIVAATSYPNFDWVTADQHERAVLQIISDYILPAVVE